MVRLNDVLHLGKLIAIDNTSHSPIAFGRQRHDDPVCKTSDFLNAITNMNIENASS